MKVTIDIEIILDVPTCQARLTRDDGAWRFGLHTVTRHAGGNGDDPWYSIEGPGFEPGRDNDWSRLEDAREVLGEWYMDAYFKKEAWKEETK